MKKILLILAVIVNYLSGGIITYNGHDYVRQDMNTTVSGELIQYIVTAGTINYVDPSSVVSVYINGVDVTGYGPSDNLDTLSKINDMYFIDYTPRNKHGILEVVGTTDWSAINEVDTVYVDTVAYTFTGAYKRMFIIGHEINYINSSLTDSVSINDTDITNRNETNIPDPVDNKHYIYFESSNVDGSIDISLTEVALPVELQSYSYHVDNNVVYIKWTTATETESSKFLIKRNDELIGDIDAHGTTTSEHDYCFQDISPPEGELEYKVFEIDYSGNINFAFAISVNYNTAEQLKISLYPNPVNTTINIALETGMERNVKIKMYNILGKVVKEFDTFIFTGNNIVKLDLSNISTGIYTININNSINKKILVLK